jgi:UDP-GlcNAc:undecaprenyl-phosphate GlcNAc-1-phosphate transferase
MNVDLTAIGLWPLLLAFFGALGLGLALTPVVERHCRETGLSRPSAVPRLGGVAIAIAALVPIITTLSVGRLPIGGAEAMRAIGLTFLALVVLALGIADDVRGTSPREKLVVQTFAAIATWVIGVRIERLTGVSGTAVTLAPWLSLCVTTIWIVGITNAMNLIDGLDGLAAGVGLVAVITFGVFGWMDGHGLVVLVAASLVGALIGFLVFNWTPARITMGDSGSLFLGYLLAVTGILCTVKQYTAFAVGVPVLALGIPIADTALAIVRRIRRGTPVTEGDRDHVHHRLVKAGLSQRDAVVWLYGGAIGLATVALAARAAHAPVQALAIGVTIVVVTALVRLIRRGAATENPGLDLAAAQDLVRRRTMTRAIRESRNVDDLWETTLRALIAQGVIKTDLELYTKTPARWSYGRATSRHRTVQLCIPLFGDDHTFGVLQVVRRRYSDDVHDRQREVQIHVTAEALIDALETLTPELRREWVVTRLPVRP